MNKKIIAGIIVLIIVVGGIYFYFLNNSENNKKYSYDECVQQVIKDSRIYGPASEEPVGAERTDDDGNVWVKQESGMWTIEENIPWSHQGLSWGNALIDSQIGGIDYTPEDYSECEKYKPVIVIKECAEEGEQFSQVYTDEYPEHCCNGLTEWESGFDTSISIEDECYGTALLSGYPVGTCINCGNGICEDIENPCNCPEDCTGKGKSNYQSIQEFCEEGYDYYCEEGYADGELCNLC